MAVQGTEERKGVVEALTLLLADSYALYTKTLNYHWNVEGPHFAMLHEMFEKQYKDLAHAVDEIAERIRTLGHKVDAAFSSSSLQEARPDAPYAEMVRDLASDQEVVLASLKKVLRHAQEARDEASASLAVERIAVHEKTAWMLRSTLV